MNVNASSDDLVGRRAELARLSESLEATARGNGQIVMIAGEPGIGKTRIARHVAAEAAARNLQVLWGRCNEEPGAPPYWPWLQAIEGFVAQYDEPTIRAALGRGASIIAEIAPSVIERCADLPPPVRANDPDQARFQLFDALTAFWKRVAGTSGLVLILDNLHCADTASLRFLEFLASEVSNQRMLILGTYRDIELTRQHPMSNTLGEIARHSWVYRVKLGGLTLEESAQLVRETAGRDLPRELLATVFSQTEGNPLFLQEMARYLAQEGVIGTERTGPSGASALRRIPEGVREAIGTRLNRLSKGCNEILGCAAVIGRSFRPDLLQRLTSDIGGETCLASLEEAESGRVIEPGVEPGTYEFTHALIRETLYDELSAVRRARLHQRVAAALEAMSGASEMTTLAAIAHHYCAALPGGDADKASEYARRAAERADALAAYEESARLYRLTLQALEAKATADDTARAELLLLLGESLTKAGEYVEARETFQHAVDGLRSVRSPATTRIIARAAISFETASWRPGARGDAAARLLRDAFERFGPEDSAEKARVLAALARALVFCGVVAEANQVSELAIAVARRMNDAVTLEVALRMGLSVLYPQRLDEFIEQTAEAIGLADQIGSVDRAMETMTWRLTGLALRGNSSSYRPEFASFRRRAEQLRQPFYLYYVLTASASSALLEGRLAESERFAEEALALGQRQPGIDALGVYGVQMFSVRREQGRLREVAPVVQHFVASARESAAWRPGLTLIYAELDLREDAKRTFDALAADDFGTLPLDTLRVTAIGYLAEVCVYLNDSARAAVLYDLLSPHRGCNLLTGSNLACSGAADRHLGMLAATMQRWDQAERHFLDAAQMNTRQEAWTWVAHTQHRHAAMLIARGRPEDRQRAADLVRTALDASIKLGMNALAERLTQLHAKLDTPSERAANPAGLSDREVEVLRLVTIGRSNKEIGKALFLSENTVANHVRNILAKTETANRTEAAGFARREGLL